MTKLMVFGLKKQTMQQTKCPRCKKGHTTHIEADDTIFCHSCGYAWSKSDYEDLKGWDKS